MSWELTKGGVTPDLASIIATALVEDLGEGDHTTLATVVEKAKGRARLLVKEVGVLAGLAAVAEVFKQVDPGLHMEMFKRDGDVMEPGDIAFEVAGRIRSILGAERLSLNILQRMSGIATHTRALVDLIDGSGARLLDTRKTTPGFRLLEKEAVRLGGGVNHRFGLYDMIMIKDNHVDAAGGIVPAIDKVQAYLRSKDLLLKVEIEVRNVAELEAVLGHGGVHRIMLDNFGIGELADAVCLIDGRYETEASGGITEKNIRAVADTGVDYISVGALTHHIKSLDLSLKIC